MKALLAIILTAVITTTNVATATAQQTRNGYKPIEEEAQEEAPGETYAVIVGISKYQYLPKLAYADADAKMFRNLLLQQKVPADHMLVLLNDTASLNNLDKGYTNWIFDRNYKSNDRLIIYLAGHGDANTEGDYYFLPVNCKPEDVFSNIHSVSFKNVQDKLNALVAKTDIKILFIVDACSTVQHPANNGGKNRNKSFDKDINSNEVLLTASISGQAAVEGPDYGGGHGLFSWYLVGGLSGAADGSCGGMKDNKVTLAELECFITTNVNTRLATRSPNSNTQTPLYRADEKLNRSTLMAVNERARDKWKNAEARYTSADIYPELIDNPEKAMPAVGHVNKIVIVPKFKPGAAPAGMSGEDMNTAMAKVKEYLAGKGIETMELNDPAKLAKAHTIDEARKALAAQGATLSLEIEPSMKKDGNTYAEYLNISGTELATGKSKYFKILTSGYFATDDTNLLIDRALNEEGEGLVKALK